MNRLQTIANILASADELLAIELEAKVPASAMARLLKAELELVLEHARQVAGFAPAAPKKRGGK